MIRFARAWILRPLGRDTLRSLLTVVSVMLGVAVVVAIELAGEAAAGSFRSSLGSLTGHADFTITANGGVDEAWAGRLAMIPRNLSFFPVLERQVLVPGTGDVTLVGLDFVPRALEESAVADGESRAGDCSLLPSSALARRLRLQPRQSLRLAIRAGRAVVLAVPGCPAAMGFPADRRNDGRWRRSVFSYRLDSRPDSCPRCDRRTE